MDSIRTLLLSVISVNFELNVVFEQNMLVQDDFFFIVFKSLNGR